MKSKINKIRKYSTQQSYQMSKRAEKLMVSIGAKSNDKRYKKKESKRVVNTWIYVMSQRIDQLVDIAVKLDHLEFRSPFRAELLPLVGGAGVQTEAYEFNRPAFL